MNEFASITHFKDIGFQNNIPLFMLMLRVLCGIILGSVLGGPDPAALKEVVLKVRTSGCGYKQCVVLRLSLFCKLL